MSNKTYDAVVVGSGPNGLAAAIALAQAGRSVLVLEAQPTLGGGCRSAALTLPRFTHDVCSAVHPLAVASPFFQTLPLHRYGLEWIEPPIALAHPLDDGTAALLCRSLEKTAQSLGADARAYRKAMGYFAKRGTELLGEVLSPWHFPKHPWLLARFGVAALRSAESYIRAHFRTPLAQGLFAGLAAHSFLPLSQRPSNAFALLFAVCAHRAGWPIPKGGAQALTDALAAHLRSLGGELATDARVEKAADLPPAKAVIFDLVPQALLPIAAHEFSPRYRRQLEALRPGPAVFKMDWALSGPAPWKAPACEQASTVHLGGTLTEIIESERAPWEGRTSPKPFVLVSQPSQFDPSRAPAGKHTLWAYCHVPRDCETDMSAVLESQIERFAPGFKQRILARHVHFPKDLQKQNANYVGGDISGGIADLRQALFRPGLKWNPYRTSRPDWYLCSASTPPGAGVHGMCGYFAAQQALKSL